MFGLSCEFRYDQHYVFEPRFLEWMKRQVGGSLADRLFVYFHLEAGTFVIALWESPVRKRWFRDVINLGHSLENFDREQALNLLLNLKDPQSGRDIAEQMKASYRGQEAARLDDQCEARERRLHKQSSKLSLIIRR